MEQSSVAVSSTSGVLPWSPVATAANPSLSVSGGSFAKVVGDASGGLLCLRRFRWRSCLVGVLRSRAAATGSGSSVGGSGEDKAFQKGGRLLHLSEELSDNVDATATTSASPPETVPNFVVPAVVAVVGITVVADLVVGVLFRRTSP